MTRPSTPTKVEGTKRTLTVKRCCEQCGRELGDATPDELEAAMSGAPLPDVAVECGCGRVVEQVAMFMQARDVREWGIVRDGVMHPTWDEADPVGKQEYVKDATAVVRAMVALGWAPKDEPQTINNNEGQS